MKYPILLLLAGLTLLGLVGCTGASAYQQEYDRMLALEPDYRLEEVRDPGPAIDKTARLSDYLTHAAHNNHGLKAAFYRWKASLERVPQAQSLDDPMFSYTNFVQAVETRVGPQRNAYGYSQKFPLGDKLERRADVALQEAHAAYQVLQGEVLKVAFRVKTAYYEYYYLNQAIRLAQENQKLMSDFERIASARFRANEVSGQQDVLRAQVELGKITNELATLKDLQPAIVAKLNAALNRPGDAPLPPPSEQPMLGSSISDAQLIAWALENNPRLKELHHQTQKTRDALALARLNRLPDLTIGVKTIDTGPAAMPGVRHSGMNPFLLDFSINLPFVHERQDAKVRQAEAEQRVALGRHAQFVYDLNADLKMAAYQLRDAQRQTQLYRDSLIPKGRQTLQVAESDYESGKGDFLSLLDSQRVLLTFELAYHRGLANYHQRRAELEKLVGTPLTDISTETDHE